MKHFRVIVAGGREFNNYDLLKKKLDVLLANKIEDCRVIIVSGTANGADKLGERYAKENDLQIDMFPADWDKWGRSAGHRRNKEMAFHADSLIAFFDGSSKGTGGMIETMRKLNKPIRVVRY